MLVTAAGVVISVVAALFLSAPDPVEPTSTPAPDSTPVASTGTGTKLPDDKTEKSIQYIRNYERLAPKLKSLEVRAAQVAREASQNIEAPKARKIAYIQSYLTSLSDNSQQVAPILPSPAADAESTSEFILEGVESDSNYRNNVVTLLQQAGSQPPRPTAEGITSDVRVLTSIPDSGFPDCVAIRIELPNGEDRLCSGTLIAPRVVSSAAHCYYPGATYEVFVGQNIFQRGQGVPVGVKAVVPHGSYQAGNPGQRLPPKNDIMLVILSEDAPLSIAPVRRIAPAAMIRSNSNCRVVGYGSNSRSGSGGEGIRRRADVAMRTPDCTSSSQRQLYGCSVNSELVAGHSVNDTCYGDSGGPLYVQDPATLQWLVAGVTSRGIPCDSPNGCASCGRGGIYTRLDYYYNWIENVCRQQTVTPPRRV